MVVGIHHAYLSMYSCIDSAEAALDGHHGERQPAGLLARLPAKAACLPAEVPRAAGTWIDLFNACQASVSPTPQLQLQTYLQICQIFYKSFDREYVGKYQMYDCCLPLT